MHSCLRFYGDLVALFVNICTYLQYILLLTIKRFKGFQNTTTAFTFVIHYQIKVIFKILLIAVRFSLLDVLYEAESSCFFLFLLSHPVWLHCIFWACGFSPVRDDVKSPDASSDLDSADEQCRHITNIRCQESKMQSLSHPLASKAHRPGLKVSARIPTHWAMRTQV